MLRSRLYDFRPWFSGPRKTAKAIFTGTLEHIICFSNARAAMRVAQKRGSRKMHEITCTGQQHLRLLYAHTADVRLQPRADVIIHFLGRFPPFLIIAFSAVPFITSGIISIRVCFKTVQVVIHSEERCSVPWWLLNIAQDLLEKADAINPKSSKMTSILLPFLYNNISLEYGYLFVFIDCGEMSTGYLRDNQDYTVQTQTHFSASPFNLSRGILLMSIIVFWYLFTRLSGRLCHR